jgi:hypothetical protein
VINQREVNKAELDQRKVPLENLSPFTDFQALNFKDTSELEPLPNEIIGQERAVRAMDFGLRMKHEGYNLFLSGPVGTGKTTYAYAKVSEIAKKDSTPGDVAYVYNFQQPDFPMVLEFNAGEAAVFKKDIEELVQELRTEIKKTFDSEDFEARQAQIRRKFETRINDLWYGMENAALRKGFSVQKSSTGIFTVPIDQEGKPMPREEFLKLPEEKQAEINAQVQDVQAEVNDVLRKIRSLEKDMRKEIANVERETGLYSAGYLINQLKEDYKEYPKVGDYLDNVLEDVIHNLTTSEWMERKKKLQACCCHPKRNKLRSFKSIR